MKILFLKDYKNGCCPRTNVQEMTFLILDDTRHWLSISNLSLKNMKVKGRQSPDHLLYVDFFSNFVKLSETVVQSSFVKSAF